MKFKFFVLAIATSFFFGSCTQDDLQSDLLDQGIESELSRKKGGIGGGVLGMPCPTALFAQNMPAGTQVEVFLNGVFQFCFVNTYYTTLLTNSLYEFNIPSGATVTYCSCGENYGTLTGPPFDFILDTSNDSTPYTTCAF